MPPFRLPLRSPIRRFPLSTISIRPASASASASESANSSSSSTNSPGWKGRQAHENSTNQEGVESNVHTAATSSGKNDRASSNVEQSESSQAAGEMDKGNQNEKAKRDHPEAPGPVIGMNDERGQVGH